MLIQRLRLPRCRRTDALLCVTMIARRKFGKQAPALFACLRAAAFYAVPEKKFKVRPLVIPKSLIALITRTVPSPHGRLGPGDLSVSEGSWRFWEDIDGRITYFKIDWEKTASTLRLILAPPTGNPNPTRQAPVYARNVFALLTSAWVLDAGELTRPYLLEIIVPQVLGIAFYTWSKTLYQILGTQKKSYTGKFVVLVGGVNWVLLNAAAAMAHASFLQSVYEPAPYDTTPGEGQKQASDPLRSS